MNRTLFAAVLWMAAPAMAADADYFPLQVGNRWVLQTTTPSAPELQAIEVQRSRVLNGTTWYLVSGYAPGDTWLRRDADGSIYALDEKTGNETVLAKVAPGAAEYKTGLSGCEQTAQADAQKSVYRGPNYTLENAVGIQYAPDSCRDIGITREVYAPGIGLAGRAITTFAGERTFELVYARVGGAAVLGKSGEIVLVDDFSRGSHGWLPGFTDYGLAIGDLRMLAELRALPEEIGSTRTGYYLQSMNRSDDLFMFLKRHVGSEDGLAANQSYRVSFEIRFASDAPTGCVGVGGSPGDSVYLKAGASADEPLAVLDANRFVSLSADKGQQSSGGKDAGVVGTIANGTQCTGVEHPFVEVRKSYAHPATIHTDDRGTIWLLAGTDSGFEGLTGLYVESITARINADVSPATVRNGQR